MRQTYKVLLVTAVLSLCQTVRADDNFVSILAKRIGGHIHPSICRAGDGTLIVVYKGANVLMCSRSSDQGTDRKSVV